MDGWKLRFEVQVEREHVFMSFFSVSEANSSSLVDFLE